MNFEYAPEFQKEVKKLQKKWRSLPDDLKAAQNQITSIYEQAEAQEEFRTAFFNGKRAAVLYENEHIEAVKMRLDVESIATNSKVRILFIAVKDGDTVTFIEMYAKNDKSTHNQKRLNRYMS